MPSDLHTAVRELAVRSYLTHQILLTKVKEAGGENHLRGNLKTHYTQFEAILAQVFAFVKAETGNEASVLGSLTSFAFKGGKLQDIDEFNTKMDVEFRALMKEVTQYEDSVTKALMLPDPVNYPKMATSTGTYDIYERVKQLSTRSSTIILQINERMKNTAAKEHEKFDSIVGGFQQLIPQIAQYLQKISGERESDLGKFKHILFTESIKEELEDFNDKLSRWSDLWNLEVSNFAPSTLFAQATTVLSDTASAGISAVGGLVSVITSPIASAISGPATPAHKYKVTVPGLQSSLDYFVGLSNPSAPVKH